jgi:hypothetical protein
MRRFRLLLPVLACLLAVASAMGAVGANQICVERWYHSDGTVMVYMPTGKGDWWRFRLQTRSCYIATGTPDETYYGINGATRGNVYQGTQAVGSGDANSGMASASAYFNRLRYEIDVAGDYLKYNVVASRTHFRAHYLQATGWDTMIVTWYDAGDEVVKVEDEIVCGTTPSTWRVTPWYAIPTGATYVRITAKTDSAARVSICGVDWIDTTTEVDPDTAGSMMMDGLGGDTDTILAHDGWDGLVSSVEMAVFWNTDGGGYAAGANNFGGISHAGIKNCTTAHTTQTGDSAAAAWEAAGAWATYKGTRNACDTYRIAYAAGDVYLTGSDYSGGVKGALTGTEVFGPGFVNIDMTVTTTEAMDVFLNYACQWRHPVDVTRVLFNGHSAAGTLSTSTVNATVRTNGMAVWGGEANTVVRIETPQYADGEFDGGIVPQVAYSAASGSTPATKKSYLTQYHDTTTPLDVALGETIKARCMITLADQGVAEMAAPVRGSFGVHRGK